MEQPQDSCAHEPCQCAPGASGYCSGRCQEDAMLATSTCGCEHESCQSVAGESAPAQAVQRTEPEEAAEEGYPAPATAGDVMHVDLPVVDERTPAARVARKLHATGSPMALVQRDGETIGVVTQEDADAPESAEAT